ncbi:hypothetical protein BH11PSE3_BH11PSE3_28910 [soil metagenome]
MTKPRLISIAVTLAFALVTAACTTSGTPQDGRYQTRGGGWDNFRATAPDASPARES